MTQIEKLALNRILELSNKVFSELGAIEHKSVTETEDKRHTKTAMETLTEMNRWINSLKEQK